MESEVARSGAGIHFGIGRIVGRESAFGGVEMVEQDFVEAEIGGERATIFGAGSNPGGVGALLAPSVEARNRMLGERRGGHGGSVLPQLGNTHAFARLILVATVL